MSSAEAITTSARFRLDECVAIVTGAAGLLAEEHAIALAESGADVVLVDLNADVCRARAAEIARRTGRRPLGLACEVTSKAARESLVDQVLAELGRV